MSTHRSFILTVVTVLIAVLIGSDALAARGYTPRACGFDMDDDGIVGEPGDDCNVCDGVTTDPDGDGVAEDLIYVDCNSGNDQASCGSPGSPCRSINYAWNVRADGPGDGAEDIICFRGTCRSEKRTCIGKSGVPGTKVRARSGNEAYDFRYPTNPSMVVGWDSDNDGMYPPFDSDDVAVLDGNASDARQAFSMMHAPCVGRDNFELAHFSATGYGTNVPDNNDIGFMSMRTSGTGQIVENAYFHDLALSRINAGKSLGSGNIVIAMWQIAPIHWFAVENLDCNLCGGFFTRGSGSDTFVNPDNGPFRFKNLSIKSRGCSSHAGGECPGDSHAAVTISKLWGPTTGIEFIDGKYDANICNDGSVPCTGDKWLPAPITQPTVAFLPAQCSRGWHIVNNTIVDYAHGVGVQPEASGYCSIRPIDNITIAKNSLLSGPASSRYFYNGIAGFSPVYLGSGNSPTTTIANVTISNNFISSTFGYSFCIASNAGYSGSCNGSHPGQIRIVNNTCAGRLLWVNAAINIGVSSGGIPSSGCPADAYMINNNIVSGIPGPGRNIRFGVRPAELLQMDNNVYDPNGTYQWVGRAETSSFATWQADSGKDQSSAACEPRYVNVASADLHLQPDDQCAQNRGLNLTGTGQAFDIDGGARPASGVWDIGADEVGSAGDEGPIGGLPPGDPPPPPPGPAPPPAPKLLEVVPLGS